MPSPEPESTSILLKSLGGAVAIILTLVGILYHKLTDTDKDQQGQLDEGAEEFTRQKVDVAKIHKDIESIRDWIKELEEELAEVEVKQMQDHESLILVKDHHKRNHGEEIK